MTFGAVAQLGERRNGIAEVDGSIPFSSTIGLGGSAPKAPRIKTPESERIQAFLFCGRQRR